MSVFNLERVFQQKKERGWHTIYVSVDAHGTLILPYHNQIEFYPNVVEVMRWFNWRGDFKVILWTSSHYNEINAIRNIAWENGFHFDFVNENPLEKNSDRACFDKKFYFNLLIDDKAGFSPEDGDWLKIKEELIKLGEWDGKVDK